MIQFGAIKFCRTILVSSCGLKKKKSHYNSRVSLHEAPTKKAFAWTVETHSALTKRLQDGCCLEKHKFVQKGDLWVSMFQ